jgi:hypothetical protein
MQEAENSIFCARGQTHRGIATRALVGVDAQLIPQATVYCDWEACERAEFLRCFVLLFAISQPATSNFLILIMATSETQPEPEFGGMSVSQADIWSICHPY